MTSGDFWPDDCITICIKNSRFKLSRVFITPHWFVQLETRCLQLETRFLPLETRFLQLETRFLQFETRFYNSKLLEALFVTRNSLFTTRNSILLTRNSLFSTRNSNLTKSKTRRMDRLTEVFRISQSRFEKSVEITNNKSAQKILVHQINF